VCPVCLSVCLSVSLSVCPSVRPSVCLSVCPSVCLSDSLFACLSVSVLYAPHGQQICVSVYLSISVWAWFGLVLDQIVWAWFGLVWSGLSVSQSICLFATFFVRPCPSVGLPVCLCDWLSMLGLVRGLGGSHNTKAPSILSEYRPGFSHSIALSCISRCRSCTRGGRTLRNKAYEDGCCQASALAPYKRCIELFLGFLLLLAPLWLCTPCTSTLETDTSLSRGCFCHTLCTVGTCI
jgi:hypothetical protein